MAIFVGSMRFLRILFKSLGVLLALIIIMIMIGYWMLKSEKYQNLLAKKAAQYLSEKIKTPVQVSRVKFEFFNDFNIEGVYIEDQQKDTLAYIGSLGLKTSELFSNYWNNETPVLKHLVLSDVLVNMKRNSDTSRWNYAFIEEAFSGTAKDTTVVKEDSIPKSNSPMDPILDIKQIAVENIRFNMLDAWYGEDMIFNIPNLTLDIHQFKLDKKKIDINSLAIDQADINIKEYTGGKPEDLTPDDSSSWGTAFNPELFGITIGELDLRKSHFSYTTEDTKPLPHEFDEGHLDIKDINIALRNTRVVADSIFTRIQSFEAKERCGLVIESLSADAKISQVHSALTNLKLKTNHSYITDSYEMFYDNFHDFNDYIAKVNMSANLSKSSVSSLDIGYFANILNEYPISINIDGKINGTVQDLSATQLKLATLNTSFNGDARVTNLPDIDKALFNIQAKDFKTSGYDLNKLIPQTRVDAVNWASMKQIRYQGSYTGKVDQFNAKGNLLTNLGNANLDLSMNFKPKNPTYKGELSTEKFDIGTLIKQTELGKISMKGVIDGQGFDLNTLNAKVNATVSYIEVDNTVYEQMTINGLVENKKFDGIFISQDEKLAVNFDGKLDLSGKQPSYNFNSRFVRFNLQKMGLTEEPILGSGYVSLNFTGNNIDDFSGTALLKNLTIENQGKFIHIDKIDLSSYLENGRKTINLKSSIVDAKLEGLYKISELAPTVQRYLYYYLPDYIKKPQNYADQAFKFEAKFKDVEPILQTLAPQIKGLSNSYVDASIKTGEQSLTLDITIPNAGYENIELHNMNIVSVGDFNSFVLSATTGNILYNDEVMIPSVQINSGMANDTASLSINSQSINDLLGDATINCKARASNNQLIVQMLPSSFKIKNDEWQFSSSQDLIFGKYIDIKDFVIENGAQKITLNANYQNTNNADIMLSNIDLESISDYTNNTAPVYYGRVSGLVHIDDFMEHPKMQANLYTTNPIRIDQDTLGIVNLLATYDVDKSLLIIDPSTSIKRSNSDATVEGYVNGKDSLMQIKTNLDNTSISFLNQFLSDYIVNLKGFVTGKVNVSGRLDNPSISGSLSLNNSQFKVLFLGTSYFINQANLVFNNRRIDIDDFNLKDERDGNYYGQVSGYITHDNFADFFLNLNVKADNLLCLNTKEADNELFYGYVPGKIKVGVKGDLNDVFVDMNVTPLKGSVFHLPINSKGDASTYDYIEFAEFGRSQEEGDKKKKSSSYVNLDMNINATPDAVVNIILDNNTGEEIVARGNGSIRMNIDLGNSIEMYGNYGITEGVYNFNFRGILPRKFNIEEGSKITWSGDALAADMDIKAVYQTPSPLALYPLVSNLELEGSDLDEAKKRYKTFIPIYLTDQLSQPQIKFDIQQPDNKSVGTPGYTRLEQLRNDEKELISQAGVILLLGDFKASEGISATSYSHGAVSTVSDVITGALSTEITNQFQNLTGLKNININVGYQNRQDNFAENPSNVNQFSVNLSANLFKDRVIVDFGNSVDVNRNETGKTNSVYAGDFKAQFLLTQDGRVRLNTYRINDPNLEGSANNGITKSGIGVSYRQTFNKFSDLVNNKKRKTKKAEKSKVSKEGDVSKAN